MTVEQSPAGRAAIAAYLASCRDDPDFRRRLREHIDQNRHILDRLGRAPVNTGRLSDER